MADDRTVVTAGVDRTTNHSALPIGARVGRYQIVSVLGQGAFGITYRARDTHLERDVAIKEYLPALLAARPDGIGVLYRITHSLSDLDLDVRSAKIHTLGAEVVDAFYVRDRSGAKVTDPEYLAEIERAIVHALTEEW